MKSALALLLLPLSAMFASSALLALLPVLALGQDYGYGPASPAASSSAPAAAMATMSAMPAAAPAAPAASGATTHYVTVGLGGLVYNPNNVTAAVGDQIVFEFHPKAHSLTQSSFATPCFHLTDAAGAGDGLDSGYQMVSVNATSFPTYVVNVQVTTPLWFYCAQSNHCSTGMVFAVNPPTTGNTMANYIANAKNPAATPSVSNTIVEGAARNTGLGVVASAGATTTPATVAGATMTGAAAMSTAMASAASGMASMAASGAASAASGSVAAPAATKASGASTLTVGVFSLGALGLAALVLA